MATKKYTIKVIDSEGNESSKSIETISFLGTLRNENANNIIAFADQIYDKDTGKAMSEQVAVKAEIVDGELKMMNASGKEVMKVDVSSFQVSDQFVDTVKLVTESTLLSEDAGYAPYGYKLNDEGVAEKDDTATDGVKLPYIKITFAIPQTNTTEPTDKNKNDIRLSIYDIWNVTNAGDISLSNNYKEADTNAAVAAGDSVETAVGKVEKKADDAQSAADKAQTAAENAQSQADKGITELYRVGDKVYAFGKTVTTGSEQEGNVVVIHAKGEQQAVAFENSINGVNVADSNVCTTAIDGTTLTITGGANGNTTVVATDTAGTATTLTVIVKAKQYIGEQVDLSDKQDKLTTITEKDGKAYYNGTTDDDEIAKKSDIPTTSEIKTVVVNEATKATQDGNGNVISETYLTKTDAESTYLSKTDATETYLTAETANSKTYDVSLIDGVLN